MDATGSRDLKLWFADGTNYPGEDDVRERQDRLAEVLAAVYERLSDDQRMLLEYKLFESAFYTTDVPDWGTAYAHCLKLGSRAQVVVDTGHHAPGTNIEFIVAALLREGRLGAFDFNSRFYADDDLMVGAADPFQLFRIMYEVVRGGGLTADVAFMLDQCHNIEEKIPALIRSVMNVQEATAKALLVDRGPWPPPSAPATSWRPTPCSWTPTTRTYVPCSPRSARNRASTAIRWPLPALRLGDEDRRGADRRTAGGLGGIGPPRLPAPERPRADPRRGRDSSPPHPSRRDRQSSQMKYGAPITAVSSPTGICAGAMIARPTRSDTTTSSAPSSALTGMTRT